jgi:hypothetical protein
MVTEQIRWPEDLLRHVEKHAKSIGGNFSHYIRVLAAQNSRFAEPKLPVYKQDSRVTRTRPKAS